MRREDRIQQILDCTLNLIGQKSIDAIRTSEIARSSGITEGALFKYFSSKDEIFDQIVQRYIQTRHPLVPADQILTLDQFREFMENYLTSVIQPSAQRISYLRLLLQVSMAQHPLARKKYRQVADGFWTIMENRIEYGKKHWGFRDDFDTAVQVRLFHLSLLMFFIEQEVFNAKSIEAFEMNHVKETAINNLFDLLLSR